MLISAGELSGGLFGNSKTLFVFICYLNTPDEYRELHYVKGI
jgi:hypothetical protein